MSFSLVQSVGERQASSTGDVNDPDAVVAKTDALGRQLRLSVAWSNEARLGTHRRREESGSGNAECTQCLGKWPGWGRHLNLGDALDARIIVCRTCRFQLCTGGLLTSGPAKRQDRTTIPWPSGLPSAKCVQADDCWNWSCNAAWLTS